MQIVVLCCEAGYPNHMHVHRRVEVLSGNYQVPCMLRSSSQGLFCLSWCSAGLCRAHGASHP